MLSNISSPSGVSIRRRTSRTSIDLDQLQSIENNPPILSESLTLESISTAPSGPIPPFPTGRTIPVFTLLGLGTHVPLFPEGLPHLGDLTDAEKHIKITHTIPTAPRLRLILKESICVSNWVKNLVATAAPGHTPWGDVEEVAPASWVPEGSIYPPDAIAEALLIARRSRQIPHPNSRSREASTAVTSIPGPSTSRARSASYQQTSFRNALVFEREITLKDNGKTKRWSLQIPATTMNPEMVDMMLELQDLNSFFKEGLEDLDHSVLALGKEKERLDPPSLMVSNSHCTFPLSLESSGILASGTPTTLATRRGKMTLPPLALKKPTYDVDPYSSIPTAFLGSPSMYSPKFEFRNSAGDDSLDLHGMISSLRSQCMPLQSPGPIEALGVNEATATPTTESEEEDEWAFAANLLDRCDNHSASVDPTEVTPVNARQPFGRRWETMANCEDDIQLSTSEPRMVQVRTAENPTLPLTSRPPSTPLPPHPTLVSPLTPRREVRGILKSCKSVRFASLPTRRLAPPTVESPEIKPQHSRGSVSATVIRQPSSLRKLNPKQRPGISTVVTSTPDNMKPSRAVRPQSTNTSTAANRPVLSAPQATAPRLKKMSSVGHVSSPLRHSITTQIPAQKPTAFSSLSPSLARHSLGRAVKIGKENKASPAPSLTPARWTLNENTLRRSSVSPEKGQKSRMPVPLRNVLARFK